MDYHEEFLKERKIDCRRMFLDKRVSELGMKFITDTAPYKYSYNFLWLGRPVIQFPQDLMAMQEIIWAIKPDLIIETGIAHGGMLIFYASMLEIIGKGEALGIDIEIRPHNRETIEKHSMFRRITLIEGSSTSQEVIERVQKSAKGRSSVLVCLDSNHTHEHVLNELRLYSFLVTKGSYLVVFDTVIDDMPENFFTDRPWGVGNNPKTAVREFLETSDRFVVDKEIEGKLLITVAPGGYLKCVKD
jgi:cephalosporin hydroxylase